jgi:KaiC/GvpD/RAD55 family RecA-like ATPase
LSVDVSFGIDEIDQLLGGSLLRGRSYLLEADNGTQPQSLLYPFIKYAITQGELVVFATNEAPAEDVLAKLKDYSINVDKVIKAKQLLVLDLWSENEENRPGIIRAGNPDDPHKVLYTYNQAYKIALEERAEMPRRVVMESLSGAVSNFGYERAHRLAIRAVRMMKIGQAVGLSVLIPKMHPPTVSESYRRLYDGCIQLTLEEHHNRLQKFIRILKSPLPSFETRRIPYEVASSGLAISIDGIEKAEEMKSGLHQVAEGVLQLFGERCMILPTEALAHLVRQLLTEKDISKVGPDIYASTYKSVRRAPTFLLKRITSADPDNPLKGFTRIIKLLGFGDLEISKDPTSEEYTIILRKSPIAEVMKGFGAPVDFIHAGIIAAMLEELEGKPMRCQETMCLAKGDTHCEFQAGPGN